MWVSRACRTQAALQGARPEVCCYPLSPASLLLRHLGEKGHTASEHQNEAAGRRLAASPHLPILTPTTVSCGDCHSSSAQHHGTSRLALESGCPIADCQIALGESPLPWDLSSLCNGAFDIFQGMVVSRFMRKGGFDVFSSSPQPTGITPDIGVLCRWKDGFQAVSGVPRSQETPFYSRGGD